ncbi:MAG: 2-oxoacid:acceptor oxidoreductase subunit alpha, partial [Methanobacteriota archaeon]
MARELNPKLAKMVSNMVYVGIMAEMLEIPQNIVEEAISKQFNGKEKAIEINSKASIMGRKHFKDNCEKKDAYYVEARDKDNNRF